MKKVLFVANIHKHLLAFHLPYMRWFKEQGCVVHAAAGGDAVELPFTDRQFELSLERAPFRLANIKAYRQLSKIVEQERYALIHCHTAMGSVVARMAGRRSRAEGLTKILYTAHGFHFFRGGPKRYWFLYYPVEKYLSRFTDAIITINREDFRLVQGKGFRNTASYMAHGVGIRTERLVPPGALTKASLREQYGYGSQEFILIYVAEFIPRKNHRFLVESLPLLAEKIPDVRILFAGRGLLQGETQGLAHRLAVGRHADFLGFRDDVGNLLALSDVAISSSRQEGLGLNIAEAMYSGLPVVATVDRGHKELVRSGENGYLFPQGDRRQFVERVVELYRGIALRERMGRQAFEDVQKFTLPRVMDEMIPIYQRYL